MKTRIILTLLLIASLLCMLSSCKKDAKIEPLTGVYVIADITDDPDGITFAELKEMYTGMELDIEDYVFQIVSERNKNESEINNMRAEISRMGEETFNGIPKRQLVKYTLIGCGITILLIFFLISK